MICLSSVPMKRLNQWLVICLVSALPGLAHAETQKSGADYQEWTTRWTTQYADGTYLDNPDAPLLMAAAADDKGSECPSSNDLRRMAV